MYYEFEGRLNMKTLIFDEDCLIVGDSRYPYRDIEGLEVTSAQLFATYGIMTMHYHGKEISIAFPRSYTSKIRRAIKEMEREKTRRLSGSDRSPGSAAGGGAFEAAPVDPYEEMKKLKELLDLGIITEDEFARKKKEILGL